MICSNCGQETQGIKINGKLFCTNCGEALNIANLPIPESTQSLTPPKAKIINPKDESPELKEEEFELEILEAEEKALDLIIKESKKEKDKSPKKKSDDKINKNVPKLKNKNIIKHNRKRTEHVHGFTLIEGEPNPIKEPELPIPHDDMIEVAKEAIASPENDSGFNFADTKSEQHLPLLTKESKELIKKKQIQKTSALKDFFSKGIIDSTRKNKKTKKKTKKFLIFFLVISFLFIGFTGLVIYVNFFAINAERATNTAEKTASFDYNKPKYLPPGFELSYKTNATTNSINYIYEYLPDKAKTISIRIGSTSMNNEDIFDKYVTEPKKSYTEKMISDYTVWFIEDKGAIFKGNAFYEVVSSDTISTEELTKIVEGLI